MAAGSDLLDEVFFNSEVDEKVVSDLVGSLESQLAASAAHHHHLAPRTPELRAAAAGALGNHVVSGSPAGAAGAGPAASAEGAPAAAPEPPPAGPAPAPAKLRPPPEAGGGGGSSSGGRGWGRGGWRAARARHAGRAAGACARDPRGAGKGRGRGDPQSASDAGGHHRRYPGHADAHRTGPAPAAATAEPDQHPELPAAPRNGPRAE